jgi:glycosyltransferase involved in cell wall biosynthesis
MKKHCLIISASNVQNIRIRLALFNFLKDKFDQLNFCGDSIVYGFEHQIEWQGAYNRKGKVFEIIIFWRLIILFLKYKPTHIISFAPKVNIYCGVLARIFGIKHTAVISGLGSYGASITRKGSLLNKLFQISLRKTDLVLTMNASNYIFCSDIFGNDRVKRIPSEGLNTNIVSNVYKSDDSKKHILYLSRIISEKGIFLLMEAFKNIYDKHSNTELIIAGEMSLSLENGERSFFSEMIQSTGITYRGEVSELEKQELLEKSDIVVLASMYGEGLPMILLEAQLYHSLIITTNVPGCNDAVAPSMQAFYCDYTFESLENKLSQAINLPSIERRELTDAASIWVKQNHDIHHVNDVYHSYFREKSFI